MQLLRRLVTISRIRRAGLQDDAVETIKSDSFRTIEDARRQIRKLFRALVGCYLIKQHAQGEDIPARGSMPRYRYKPFGTCQTGPLAHSRHQTDIRQPGFAVNVDDVGRLDVAMDQPRAMQVGQRRTQVDPNLDALGYRQPSALLDLLRERPGHVGGGIDLLLLNGVIPHFHHVIEPARRKVAPDVQDGDEARVRARNRFEPLNALEFPIEGAILLEVPSPHNLYPAIGAQHVAGKPDLPVRSFPNHANQVMVRNARDLHSVCVFLGGHVFASRFLIWAGNTPASQPCRQTKTGLNSLVNSLTGSGNLFLPRPASGPAVSPTQRTQPRFRSTRCLSCTM